MTLLLNAGENNPASGMSVSDMSLTISGVSLTVSGKEDFGNEAIASVSGADSDSTRHGMNTSGVSMEDNNTTVQDIDEQLGPSFNYGLRSMTGNYLSLSYLSDSLFYIWLVVALILLLRKILIYRSFFISIKNTGWQISDIQILNLLADCMEQLKVRGKMEVRISPLITSPVLVGFFIRVSCCPTG